MSPSKSKTQEFKLPKYLKLAKGSMWFDVEGEGASGVRLYATRSVFLGREVIMHPDLNDPDKQMPEATEIPKDKFNNENYLTYGYIDKDLPWYIDTSVIDNKKLSRIILAYKHGILEVADPKKPPKLESEFKNKGDFSINKDGERIFVGKNTEMYKKLQNLNFEKLKDFIQSCPRTNNGRSNLLDILEYENKGYNPLNRSRFEVVQVIRNKLTEFGPGLSAIRIDD